MKKLRTSVIITPETLDFAESIVEAEDRSRSWVFTKAVEAGLPVIDTDKAKALRARKGAGEKKGKK